MSRHWWVVPPEWVNETAFLIGGGPSLSRVAVQELHGAGRVVAINDSFRLAPWADVLYFCDRKWWDSRQEEVRVVFRGHYIITMSQQEPVDGVHTLRCTGATGLETDPGALRHGSNSGYQAINLAYHFGATRIVLLGYDMQVARNGNTHWGPRPERQTAEGFQRTLQNVMLPKFSTLQDPLRRAGVQVLNATTGSALTVWPQVNLRTILMAELQRS